MVQKWDLGGLNLEWIAEGPRKPCSGLVATGVHWSSLISACLAGGLKTLSGPDISRSISLPNRYLLSRFSIKQAFVHDCDRLIFTGHLYVIAVLKADKSFADIFLLNKGKQSKNKEC